MNQIKPHNCVIRYISGNGTIPWTFEAMLKDIHDRQEAKQVLCAELGHKPDNVTVISIVSVKPAVKVER